MIQGLHVLVKGIVQGVGFRPFVYTTAVNSHLTGWVKNTSGGVEIEINGDQGSLDNFLHELQYNAPPLSRIDDIQTSPVPVNGYSEFRIIASEAHEGDFVPISPDMSICPDCRRELFNPADRRYRYPFINCTNCGPRFSIIRDTPYDRPKTTMSGFEMCPDCQTEYDNPLDRRFHAQPTACPVCGPQVWFTDGIHRLAEKDDAIHTAREWLKTGKIVAVKGLGGYHLACDAENAFAVRKLRNRKKRSDKPFALMAFDLETIREHCVVSAEEEDLLVSSQHPVVLLEKRSDSTIAEDAAPTQKRLGFMLPYTPLHLLLLEPEPGFSRVLVMTSGNMSEEPIAYVDTDAKERLAPIADAFLLHDRPIHMRVDDSVVTTHRGQLYPVRRSRGYAPESLPLPVKSPGMILGCGAELKNTFCLTRDQYAFVSHHIGDLENYETLQSFETGIEHFQRLFRIQPEFIAVDLHPDYLATRYGQNRAQDEHLHIVQVQHHHAHLASCLADNGVAACDPVIGLILDGTGFGTDGTIWGGEVLVGGYAGFQRRFHLEPFPLPGGDAAIRNPARTALALLWHSGVDWNINLPPVISLTSEERTVLRSQLEQSINTPQTSSMGRLFDAVSALAGVRQKVSYEGQAAIELENQFSPSESNEYIFELDSDQILLRSFLEQLLADIHQDVPIPVISARFHNGLARMLVAVCLKIRSETGIQTVALSGGVWQNKTLLTQTHKRLDEEGFTTLVHHQVPANDGGISLGQVAIAASTIK